MKKKKETRGRKRDPNALRRGRPILVRVTDDQRAEIETRAAAVGKAASTYLRDRGLE